MLHAQRSPSESAFGRLPACLPNTPTSEAHQLRASFSPASQSSSWPGCRAPGSGWPALPERPASSGALPQTPGAAHKRGLYLNLTFFVSPLHMNIYREEGPASTPAAPFTESINNSFVKPDLGTED